MRTHKLKCWPSYFEAVLSGAKPFEIRQNDRDYAVGDHLLLQEWDPSHDDFLHQPKGYTGREGTRVVTYLAQGVFDLPKGMCVMGLAAIQDEDSATVRAGIIKRLEAEIERLRVASGVVTAQLVKERDSNRAERDEWSRAAEVLGLAPYGGCYDPKTILPAVKRLVGGC